MKSLALFCVFLVEALLLQWLGGAYQYGFGGHPDEAAHFVSALMLHDYLAGHIGENPLGFAQDFYTFYPKVAIGNWPPLLYLALSSVFLILGASRMTALLFNAVVMAWAALHIFKMGRRSLSDGSALLAAFLFPLIQVVQEFNGYVMTETLVTALILASIHVFVMSQEKGTLRTYFLFGVIAMAAIMTRGSAWSLLIFLLMFVCMTQRWRLLFQLKSWIALIPIFAICIPWYLFARKFNTGAMMGYGEEGAFAYFVQSLGVFIALTVESLGWPLFGLFIAGLLILIARRSWFSTSEQTLWCAVIGGILSLWVLHALVPAAQEKRYVIQWLPYVLLISALAWDKGLIFLKSKLNRPRMTSLMNFLLLVLMVLAVYQPLGAARNEGFFQITQSIRQTNGSDQTVLLVSDPRGEGSFIAETAASETRPGTLIVRGSKLLIEEDWLGRNTRPKFETTSSALDFLDRACINVVVLDKGMESEFYQSAYTDFETALISSGIWKTQSEHSIIRYGSVMKDKVFVYRRDPSVCMQRTHEHIKLIESFLKRQS